MQTTTRAARGLRKAIAAAAMLAAAELCTTTMLTGCGDDAPKTEREAMDYFCDHSPEEGARYYLDYRDKSYFLANLYHDSVMPMLKYANYNEIRNVAEILKETRHSIAIELIANEKKILIMKDLKAELDEAASTEVQLFRDQIMPLLTFSLDSAVEADCHEVIEDYAGGFLNYKKLAFYVKDNEADFRKNWEEHIKQRTYTDLASTMAMDYLTRVKEQKEGYIEDVLEKTVKQKVEVILPQAEVSLSEDVKKYTNDFTSKEQKEMFIDGLTDYVVPGALAMLTGGISVAYEVGKTAYDVVNIAESIKNGAPPESNDILQYFCEDNVQRQLVKLVDELDKRVEEQIRELNQKAYKTIEEEL